LADRPEAFTNVSQLSDGGWQVEIGMSHLPYRCTLRFKEQSRGARAELECDSVTMSGVPIRPALVRGMADDLERFQEHARAAIIALRGNGGGVLRRPVRRKRELTDGFLRDVVRRHSAHGAAGRPPTATLAAEEGVTSSAVKGWLRRARERGIEGAS
jgi:hypothetical protein